MGRQLGLGPMALYRRGRAGLLVVIILSACSPTAERPSGVSQETSEFQAAILEDGVVEFAEYEMAVFAMVSCLEDAGIHVIGPMLRNDRLYAYDWGGAATSEALDDMLEAHDSCYAEYLDRVEMTYLEQNLPSEAELQQQRREVSACLREQGYELPELPSDDVLVEILLQAPPPSALACFEKLGH